MLLVLPFLALSAGSDALAGTLWTVRNAKGGNTARQVDAEALFSPAASGWAAGRAVVTDLQAIADTAEATARWIRAGEACRAIAGGGAPSVLGLGARATLETLDTIARLAREDQGTPAPRLADPDFLEATFDLWWWSPDLPGARARGQDLPADQVRVTRYLVSQLPGRAQPEGPYQHPLYADPGEAERRRYTRSQVIDGAWHAGGAKPLVYLTEQGVYEANMQGTVEVSIPGRGTRTFNVHQHNGYAYRHGVRARSQDRYWYFREVDGAYGFGAPEACPSGGKVRLSAKAAVAGDVHNLGLGRIVLMEGSNGLHLAVLADTGGAFTPNLFQLDWFGGGHPSHKALYQATSMIPETTRVGLLVVKSAEP